jgi:hypothetical protein
MLNVRLISRDVGALIGVASALPFALLVAVIFGQNFPAFAVAIALACLSSGAITGGTVGRHAVARPTLWRIAGTAAFAVAVAAPIGTQAYMLLSSASGNLLFWMISGLVIYSLPAFLLVALPGVTLGILMARRFRMGAATR